MILWPCVILVVLLIAGFSLPFGPSSQSSNPSSHLTSTTHPSGLTTAVSVYRVVFIVPPLKSSDNIHSKCHRRGSRCQNFLRVWYFGLKKLFLETPCTWVRALATLIGLVHQLWTNQAQPLPLRSRQMHDYHKVPSPASSHISNFHSKNHNLVRFVAKVGCLIETLMLPNLAMYFRECLYFGEFFSSKTN